MAIVDNLRSAPRLFFVTFALLFLGGLFVLVAIASPNWLMGQLGETSIHAGLWEACDNTKCNPIPANGVYIAIRVLCVLALLGAGGSGLVAMAFVLQELKRKSLGYLIAIGCLLSSIANTITIALYTITGIATIFEFGWSFIIACLGSSCLLFASITGFVIACGLQSSFGQTQFVNKIY